MAQCIFINTCILCCSSYTEAMTCISRLIEACPEDRHREIKVALASYSGMEQELQDLCTTNGLYESKSTNLIPQHGAHVIHAEY